MENKYKLLSENNNNPRNILIVGGKKILEFSAEIQTVKWKKKVLKFGSQIAQEVCLSLNFMWQILLLPIGSLPCTKPGPSKVPDPLTAQIARDWQVHVTSLWSSEV